MMMTDFKRLNFIIIIIIIIYRCLTCNLQPATCNLQPATCNLQITPSVTSIRFSLANVSCLNKDCVL